MFNFKYSKQNTDQADEIEMNRFKLDSDEVRFAREERVKDRLMWSKIREVGINLAFMCCAYLVAYSYNDNQAFNYKNSIDIMLRAQLPGCLDFDKV